MPLIGPQLTDNSVYQTSLTFAAGAKRFANVYWTQVMGVAAPTDGMGNLGDAVDQIGWTGVMPLPSVRFNVHSSSSRIRIAVRKCTGVPSTGPIVPIFTDSWVADFAPGASPGLDNSAAMPSAVTVSVLLRTGFVGRRYRGRKSWGPITEVQTLSTSLAELTAAAKGSWDAVAAVLTQPYTLPGGTVFRVGVYSAVLNRQLNPPSPTSGWNQVQTVRVGLNVGSLVRRKFKQP